MEERFKDDTIFFKSTELDEHGILKAKKMPIGSISPITGLKKIGPNKWIDPKTGKVAANSDKKARYRTERYKIIMGKDKMKFRLDPKK